MVEIKVLKLGNDISVQFENEIFKFEVDQIL